MSQTAHNKERMESEEKEQEIDTSEACLPNQE